MPNSLSCSDLRLLIIARISFSYPNSSRLRKNGKILVDNKTIQKNGKFIF